MPKEYFTIRDIKAGSPKVIRFIQKLKKRDPVNYLLLISYFQKIKESVHDNATLHKSADIESVGDDRFYVFKRKPFIIIADIDFQKGIMVIRDIFKKNTK